MQIPLRTLGILITGLAMCAVLAAVIFTQILRIREVDSVPVEQKIFRTLEIIRTSSSKTPKVLKVFVLRSVKYQKWIARDRCQPLAKKVSGYLFYCSKSRNGGFASQALVGTANKTLQPPSPIS